LLSDTGVGRQLHTLVGQGQIDSVLLARPQDRRAVIEEAAGILKHRRRKEKALRRLESMEANLQRLSDLARELRRQLKPLEKQAEAARAAPRARLAAVLDESMATAEQAETEAGAVAGRRDDIEVQLAAVVERRRTLAGAEQGEPPVARAAEIRAELAALEAATARA